MDIKTLNKDGNKVTFILKDVDMSFANSLRRIMMSEVSTMAIDEVEFRKNTSVLYDEILAHRLGLVVLATDLKSYNLPEGCSCKGEGCAKCQLKLTLKAKGPKVVYAEDIKSTDPKVKPVYGKTIIAKLLKNQELEFEATAVLGKGRDHMKWSPGLVWYRHVPIIKINKDSFENAEAVAASCPVKVFDAKDGKLSINKDNELKCHLCEACLEHCKDEVSIEADESQFIFTIESWGQLDPKDIVRETISEFTNKTEELIEKVKALK